MSTGPNPILKDLERRWDITEHRVTDTLGDWFHPHHPASAETTAADPTIGTTAPPEDNVSLLTEIKTDFHTIADKLESLDEEALTKLEAIQANPEAMGVFNDLAAIAGVPGLPGGILTAATSGLKVIAGMSAGQSPQPPEIPIAAPEAAMSAGPVVGGQA